MTDNVGSNFIAIDFHVHTPGSLDFRDKNAQAADIVSKALSKNLGAIVITDHNTVEWVDLVREAARGTGLCVFPGFEINAQGGHILGIFDPNAEIAQLETALIEGGISKTDFRKEDVVGKDIPAVFAAIEKNCGIALGAHVDGPKGFLTTIEQGVTKEKYFRDPNLKAVEIIKLENKDDFVAGKRYQRAMACVQGSDAHSLAEIGDKCTFIKIENCTLEGLRLAFSEPILRIKLQSEYEPPKLPYIKDLYVNQGFLSGHKFQFNVGLNCLVGGAGSGKSTILEFLRFGLNQMSTLDQIIDDVNGKLKDLAGVGCDIFVDLVLDTGEEICVKRHFDGQNNPIYIYKMPSHQELDIDIPSVFPIHAYSQGEAINIARNPLAQLELIDKHLDINRFELDIQKAYDDLDDQIEGLIKLDAKIKDKHITEKDFNFNKNKIKALNDELGKLEDAQKNPAVLSHNFWIAERTYLVSLANSFAETKKDIEQGMGALSFTTSQISLPQDITPNKAMLDECDALVKRITELQLQAKALLLSGLSEIEKQVKDKGAVWKEKWQVHDNEYKLLQIDQQKSRISEINNELEKLRTAQRSLQTKLESIEMASNTLTTLMKKRQDLLDIIQDRKNRIFALRERKAKEFVKQIGDTISLHLVPNGNKKEYELWVTEMFKGTYANKGIPEKIYRSIEPQDLYELIIADSSQKISDRADVDEKWATTLIQKVKSHPEYLYRLQTVRLEDLLEIGLRIEQGKYKPLEKLSSGQKATVIVLLTMVEGKYPVIFDQPEDALYTPFIYTEVVRTLREGKGHRQFILATHNSNIAVAGDTDLGIIIDGSSDTTTIQSTGGLENTTTKELMLIHLEGGKEAFISRKQKFGIRDSDDISLA